MIEICLSELNEYVAKKNLRKYQFLIACESSFTLLLGSQKFIFYRIFCKGNKNHLFFKKNGKLYCLISEGIATGYELKAYPYEVQDLVEIRHALNGFEVDMPLVVVGDSNFAHFIWNHLSAIIELNEHIPNLNYAHLNVNFGNLSKILNIQEAIEINAIPKYRNNFFVGGEFLNAYSHKILMGYIEPLLVSKIKHNKFILCFGIRGNAARSLTNEFEFYNELIKKLSSHLKEITIVFDGFSFDDSNKNSAKNINRFLSIDKIIENLKNNHPNMDCISINGSDLVSSFSCLSNVNFYITHAGTMQHKIAWIFLDKLGIIFTPSKNPELSALWHSNQVENSTTPLFLVSEYYSDNGGDRNKNYHIKDIELAAATAFEIVLKNYQEYRKKLTFFGNVKSSHNDYL